eukprot:5033638-Prorocentrum_lima.AAC.1
MTSSLVGSEMCIRDSLTGVLKGPLQRRHGPPILGRGAVQGGRCLCCKRGATPPSTLAPPPCDWPAGW